MDLTHRFTVPAPVEEVWTAFNHLDRLAPCFPGATVTTAGGDHFEGSVKVKLGPTALVYTGSGRYLERDAAAHRVVFEAHGTDGRGNGTATVRVTVSCTGRGSATEVGLHTDLTLTGRPAQFGAGVIADVGDKLVDQFASCVAGRLADGLDAPPVDHAPAGGAGADDTGTGEAGADEEVATDDELWQGWAGAREPGPAEDSDAVTTLEMQTVGVEAPGASGSSGVAQPRTQAVADVLSAVLTRYGPLLGLVALVVVVVQLLRRRRREPGEG